MNRIVAGALAGFVATIPMTQAMELMYRRLPPDQRFPLPPQSLTTEVVEGAVYGVGVWTASYLGWVPTSGLLGSALRQTRSRVRLMVLAHLVWGPATALLARQLESTRRGSSRFGSL